MADEALMETVHGHVDRPDALSLLMGLALAAPRPAGIELNYSKIGVKLVILIIIGGVLGMGSARQRRTGNPVARPLFISAGALSSAAAAIAVVW